MYVILYMNQNIWGPHFWVTLHTLTFNYPLKPTHSDKHSYYTFITTLKDILPCKICKKNFNRKLKEDPLKGYLNNRRDFAYWMIDCHNKVNSETGKRYYSNEEVIQIYEHKFDTKIELNVSKIKTTTYNYNIYTNIILIVLIIIIIIIIVYKMNTKLIIKKL